jgi:hypothetical protein
MMYKNLSLDIQTIFLLLFFDVWMTSFNIFSDLNLSNDLIYYLTDHPVTKGQY